MRNFFDFLYNHWFGRSDNNKCCVTGFKEIRIFFFGLTSCGVQFFLEFHKGTSNLCCVTVEYWCVSNGDNTGML